MCQKAPNSVKTTPQTKKTGTITLPNRNYAVILHPNKSKKQLKTITKYFFIK